MRTVLNAKIYVGGSSRERCLESARDLVRNRIGDLDVEYEVRLRDDDRIEVEGIGDDIEAALNHLTDTFGAMETDPKEGKEYIGTLEGWNDDGFVVDIGRDVLVPKESLTELGQGTPSQIRERFGLVQHIPLEIVWYSNRDEGSSDNRPRLSPEQVDRLWSWRKGSDRVNVNSATRAEVRATVNRAGHAHDIVTVERLGLLEQSIICEEDTDAPGLLANIGNYIRGEMMCVVS
ncbi:MAG: DUF2110 family protein [Halobacteria archaeon]|nr:DUF2110 family protein [Halobacteria archaeon]